MEMNTNPQSTDYFFADSERLHHQVIKKVIVKLHSIQTRQKSEKVSKIRPTLPIVNTEVLEHAGRVYTYPQEK